MTRYVAQRKGKSTCGPVAILNALKWAGRRVTERKHLPKLIKQCNCDKDGTTAGDFLNAFSKQTVGRKLIIHVIRDASIRTVDKHLERGYALVLLYITDRGNGHFVLITDRPRKYEYIVHNDGSATCTWGRSRLRRLMKKRAGRRKKRNTRKYNNLIYLLY